MATLPPGSSLTEMHGGQTEMWMEAEQETATKTATGTGAEADLEAEKGMEMDIAWEMEKEGGTEAVGGEGGGGPPKDPQVRSRKDPGL